MLDIFIYGTLKRGFPLHDLGLSGALFAGMVQTVRPYPLYIAAPFFGPMMLDEPGDGVQVSGEHFRIEPERLQRLDELEDVGKPGSFRSTLTIMPQGGGQPIEAVGFMKDRSWLEPLHSGILSDYQDRRFIPPWER